jgi:cytoskeletal protein RodZ
MERIGEKLRKRREELGFTIDDIARATKFRPEMIRAIEDGRTRVFAADAYLKAFLRAYAIKLGLDPAEIIREQKSEEERVQEALSGIRVKPLRREGIPRNIMRWVLVAAAVAVTAGVYYRVLRPDYSGGTKPRAEGVIQAAGDPTGLLQSDDPPLGNGSKGEQPPADEETPRGHDGEEQPAASNVVERVDQQPPGEGAEDPEAMANVGAEETSDADASADRGTGEQAEVPAAGDESVAVEPFAVAAEPATEIPGASTEIQGGPGETVGDPGETAGDPGETAGDPGETAGPSADAVEPAAEDPEPDTGEEPARRWASRPPDLQEETGVGANALSISVSGWSTSVKLLSGDKVLLEGTLRPGYSNTFYSDEAFFFSFITDKDAISLLYNGRPVRLPDSDGKLIPNLRIPPEGS